MSKKAIPRRQKQFVFERAKGCCEYCGSQVLFAVEAFSIDHVIPRVRGGETKPENLALACQGCNNHKYTKVEAIDPISGETTRLFNPRKDKWSDFFVWNEDCSMIIGMTPVGRVTVEALKLNRQGLINLRKVLFKTGDHPPKGS
ncbi:MAG: HNH endonuclease [Proteobacteria bacterium]|nr:HNH endonuclease [Pseudomonadota bacterium]